MNRYGVLLEHLNHEEVEREVKSWITTAQDSEDDFAHDFYVPEMRMHSRACSDMMDVTDDFCFLEQAKRAEQRLKGLESSCLITEYQKSAEDGGGKHAERVVSGDFYL